MNKAIEKRQTKEKELLLVQLRKVPIVQAACEMLQIGRASYYRWREKDHAFAEAADKALADGAALVNDVAESQLLTAIKEGNLSAIIFWLKHHHSAYNTRVELTAQIKNDGKLTPEQEALVDKALKLTFLMPPFIPDDKERNNS